MLFFDFMIYLNIFLLFITRDTFAKNPIKITIVKPKHHYCLPGGYYGQSTNFPNGLSIALFFTISSVRPRLPRMEARPRWHHTQLRHVRGHAVYWCHLGPLRAEDCCRPRGYHVSGLRDPSGLCTRLHHLRRHAFLRGRVWRWAVPVGICSE